MAADLACRLGGRACVQDVVDPGRGAYAVQIRGQDDARPRQELAPAFGAQPPSVRSDERRAFGAFAGRQAIARAVRGASGDSDDLPPLPVPALQSAVCDAQGTIDSGLLFVLLEACQAGLSEM